MCPKPREKEDAIMQGAVVVFSLKGFHAATMEDIAQEAGIGKGTIYEYFKSKDELFQEMILRGMHGYTKVIGHAVEQLDRPMDKLREFLRISLEYFQHHQSISNIITTQVEQPMHTCVGIKERLFAVRDEIIQKLERIFTQGMQEGIFLPYSPHEAASIFLGLVIHIHFYGMNTNTKQADLSHYADVVFDIFLHGIQHSA